jgi:hypothetical protein
VGSWLEREGRVLFCVAVLHISTVSCTERLEIEGNPNSVVRHFEYDAVMLINVPLPTVTCRV